jgi:MgtC family
MDLLRLLLGNVHDWTPPPLGPLALVATSVVCGGIVGAERERAEKPAGLRTLLLICLGSTVFTLMSIDGALGAADRTRIVRANRHRRRLPRSRRHTPRAGRGRRVDHRRVHLGRGRRRNRRGSGLRARRARPRGGDRGDPERSHSHRESIPRELRNGDAPTRRPPRQRQDLVPDPGDPGRALFSGHRDHRRIQTQTIERAGDRSSLLSRASTSPCVPTRAREAPASREDRVRVRPARAREFRRRVTAGGSRPSSAGQPGLQLRPAARILVTTVPGNTSSESLPRSSAEVVSPGPQSSPEAATEED